MSGSVIEDVLATRYASAEMRGIWDPVGKIILERELWVAVLRAQRDAGLDVPDEVIRAYERIIQDVDLPWIQAREREIRHDVKARIEAFNRLAGYEYIHRGMTSRDLTDNVEQLQVKRSMELVRERLVAVLARLSALVQAHYSLEMVGRSHNVPAQSTFFGKRLASAGEEILIAFNHLDDLIARYPLRGLKGAMGTAQDQFDLLDTDPRKVAALERCLVEHLGFSSAMNSVGQIYPRSLDYQVAAALKQVAAGPSSLATTFRLMAGQDLLTEGFKEGQVGSSAMPHKMNARTCERINGFNVILLGYEVMLGQLAGNQWNEGDVSCSVVRRVALPGMFFAIDGLIENFLTVLQEFGVYPAVIEAELNRYRPFVSTTMILMAAVKQGAEREAAHSAIKEHAVAVALEMREQGKARNDLYRRLGYDERIPLSEQDIVDLVDRDRSFIGVADQQIARFIDWVDELACAYPQALKYNPAEIL